jgi:hypothetical protein
MVGYFEKAASYRKLPEVLAKCQGGGNQSEYPSNGDNQ